MKVFLSFLSYIALINGFHVSFIKTSCAMKAKILETEEISAHRGNRGTVRMSDATRLSFCGVKFDPPLSTAMEKMGFETPTLIQEASVGPLTLGLSAILHAETGSGKTLCYLLPLLKRLYGSDLKINRSPLQALIVVPTKELAVQIAADIVALTSPPGEELDTSVVDLCVTTRRGGFQSLQAPIVVGTPFKILDTIDASEGSLSELANVRYLVLDEVDRLLSVAGKYATTAEIRGQKRTQNPCALLLDKMTEGRTADSLQIVAASATVGRPMRRELYKILKGDYDDWNQDSMPVLRAKTTVSGDSKGSMEEDARTSRAVSIPKSIDHYIELCDGAGESLRNKKLAKAKEMFAKRVNEGTCKRALLFVPSLQDVKEVEGILSFWGMNVKNVQRALGLATEKPRAARRGIQEGKARRNGPKNGNETPWKNESADEMIRRAALNRIGASSSLVSGSSADDDHLTDEETEAAPELYVTCFSGTRGLHLSDIDIVFILSAPPTMDEYLHMAGRTGRVGKKGSVVTMATVEEMKRLQSWQTPLGLSWNIAV